MINLPYYSHRSVETNPPDIDHINFGFKADGTNKKMISSPLPPGVETAADFVLKLMSTIASQASLVREDIVGVTTGRQHAYSSVHALDVNTATTLSKSLWLRIRLTVRRKKTKAEFDLETV